MGKSVSAKQILMRQALAEGYINTPGGFRNSTFVHHVRPGQSVVKRAGVSYIMDMTTAEMVGNPADAKANRNPADQAGGWVTWVTWDNQTGAAISSFATTWTVPAVPTTQSNQLIYLFNGLQDPAGKEILQPVLQWGSSGAGGGNFWSIASWHVDSNGHAFCTPSIAVNVGDVLVGLMTMTAVLPDGTRNYSCEFQGIPGAGLMALGMTELTAADETIEVYGLTGRSDYPNAPSTPMMQIDLQVMGNPAPLVWTNHTMQNPEYGEHTNIVSNGTPGGEVDLCY